MTVYTGLVDEDTTLLVTDQPEGIECGTCGVLHWGHECTDCNPDPLDFR